jgi:4-methylaminobutanoate oxidase (formaldehyde-forming)
MLPKGAQVVVIGGGVFGTSAAFHLAEAGVRDVLLVDRTSIAGGTTPFAAGQTGYLNRDPQALTFSRYCMEFFERFGERTGYPVDFRQVGSIRVALTERFQRDLESRVEQAAKEGEPAEFIDHAELRKRAPLVEAPADARMVLIPRDGYVEPRSVAAAFAAAARDRGVTIRTRLEVTAIEARDGAVRGVITPEGRVETSWAVVAAGAWGRSLMRTLGVNLRSVPVRHQAFVTAPLEGVVPGQAIVRFTEPQVYCRPEGGGLLVGGYGYRPLSFEMDRFPPGFEIPALEADPVYYRQLSDAAAALVPRLRDAPVVQERRGLPTMSPDGRILVGEPNGVRGLIVASACLVGGIERSPGMGRLVSEIVTGRPTFVPLEALHLDRFGDAYAHDAELRAACEELYSRHYHEVY